jgi:hypothetical protein
MTTQRSRGGGAVCFEHSGLAHSLTNSITGWDKCAHAASPRVANRSRRGLPPGAAL